MDQKKIDKLMRKVGELLLQSQNEKGFWDGHLSSSALGVAVSITSLYFYDKVNGGDQIIAGLRWLQKNVNEDGGFGDTPKSLSNVSTSLLCYSAINKCKPVGEDDYDTLLTGLSEYLQTQNIDLRSEKLIASILDFYKTDRTFSVPILVMCALCDVPSRSAFKVIPQLPFELVLLPRALYRLLNLSVVSYAIPALIAVGIAIFKFKLKKNPLMRLIRQAAIKKSLRLLEKLKPDSGGFLEAIPLTAFVCMCLTEAGYRESPVVSDGISFLKRTMREDGSWPIDVNLSTWVTSLAVKSFRHEIGSYLDLEAQERLTAHYLQIQNKAVHPFNGSAPGGWGWTHFSGSVPDGDDTAGAILALLALNRYETEEIRSSVINGGKWLMGLQNSDGGFPTFCRGWGKLPFDKSCADITGHAILAMTKTIKDCNLGEGSLMKKKMSNSLIKAIDFLEKHQQQNGSWLPLWFGNQNSKNQQNPVYGTARVLSYLNDALSCKVFSDFQEIKIIIMCNLASSYLANVQNSDGSWGGDKDIQGSVEETALAISALSSKGISKEIETGLCWLEERISVGEVVEAPIGLYFASLWYSENLYPITALMECLMKLSERNNAS